MHGKHLRYAALGLAAAWALWWVFFEVAEAIGEHAFGQAVAFFVLMFGAVAVAWKWPLPGAILFLMEGCSAIILFAPGWLHRFHPGAALVLFAIMPTPPLAAGILLLLSRPRRPQVLGV